MKFSKFNIIIKDGNEPYIWNTKSNAVSKLDGPTFQRLVEIKPEFILPDDFPFLDYMSANGLPLPLVWAVTITVHIASRMGNEAVQE